MILKDKTQTSSASIKLDAGIKQEHDVAFNLRRAYKNSDQVMVLNDLRIERCSGWAAGYLVRFQMLIPGR